MVQKIEEVGRILNGLIASIRDKDKNRPN